MKIAKIILVLLAMFSIMILFAGCRAYDKPEFAEISASQTAFLIPLEGKVSDQKTFESEEMLAKAKVAAKRIQIPHVWVQDGRFGGEGHYMPTVKLIVVERKPEVREWTASSDTGTANKNQGIRAETKESIGFAATVNCAAQIDENDAVKFLYRYNSKSLAEIMDSEIRNRIGGKFVEESAKYTLSDLLINKQEIMKVVRDDVIPYFKERGITISTIALNGDLSYDNVEIQKSIDQKFQWQKYKETQDLKNEKMLSEAKANAEAIRIQQSTIEAQIRLKELENQKAAIDKWNGALPQYQTGGAGTIFNLPTK